MQSLIKQSNEYCSRITRTNIFFERLKEGALDNLMFVYQLRVWCGEFIDCLFLAAGMCADRAHNKVRRRHAIEEGSHPDQLDRWMQRRGLTLPIPDMSLEGQDLTRFVRGIASYGSDPLRVLVLNVFLERLAFVTFQALIQHFTTEVLDGPYWAVHEAVDEVHAALGVDLIPSGWETEHQLEAEQTLERVAYLADKWLASLAR